MKFFKQLFMNDIEKEFDNLTRSQGMVTYNENLDTEFYWYLYKEECYGEDGIGLINAKNQARKCNGNDLHYRRFLEYRINI